MVTEGFHSTGRDKVACDVCGSDGYDGWLSHPAPWQVSHIRGHSPCPDCGVPLTLKQDGTPRKHHRQYCKPKVVEKVIPLTAEEFGVLIDGLPEMTPALRLAIRWAVTPEETATIRKACRATEAMVKTLRTAFDRIETVETTEDRG